MSNSTINIPMSGIQDKTTANLSFDSVTTFKETSDPTTDENIEEDQNVDSIQGWIVVIASFFNLFIIMGITLSSGVFVQYYADNLFKNKVPLSTLSFIGTISTSLQTLLAVFTGKLADKLGYRNSILLGSAIYVIGLLLASFSTEVWHLFLTQGVLVGIGGAIAFVPAVSAPAQWFKKYIGLATGVAVAGSGIGGLVLSPVTQTVLNNLDFRWALRVLAIIAFVILLITSFFIKERVKAKNGGSWLDFTRFKDRRFLALFFGGFLCSFGYLVPFLLMGKYAQSIGLTESQGSILIGLLNGGSAIGRVALGSLGDRFGRINILFICIGLASLFCYFIWTFSFTFGVLLAFNILYGMAAGGYISMLPVVTVQLFGVEGIASTNGLLYFGSGIPNLVGTPIASAILAASTSNPVKPNYVPVIMYAATSAILGSCLFFVLKLTVNRKLLARV
ncbi:MFS general substrate transporter [Neoconidiobolus thromboides FSU 785]|nr:MFS general substrate transporter [Neoconidiobolus thromboides FSU 785]